MFHGPADRWRRRLNTYELHVIVTFLNRKLFFFTGQPMEAKFMIGNTHTKCKHCYTSIVCVSDASRQVEEVIKNDNFVLSMKHIKPRRRLRGSVETLFAVDFPGSQQKFVLMLDRRSKRGKPASFLY